MSERGHLQVDIGGNASGFRQVLGSVQAHAKQFSKELNSGLSHSWGGIGKSFVGGIIGGLSFETIKGSFESFLSRASGLRELSEQLEMGTDETQKWEKAVDRLGLSFGGLQTVLNAIRDKRQEALTDPKAANLFERLGIPRSSVIDQQGVNSSDFAAMVMNAGRESEQSRGILSDIVGRRGLKYAAAAGLYDSQSPDIDKQTLEMAHKAELGEKKLANLKDRAMSFFINTLTTPSSWAKTFFGKGGWSNPALPFINNELERAARLNGPNASTTTPGTGGVSTGASNVVDPLKSVEAEADAKRAERRAASEERIRDAERKHMSASARRASLQEELADVQQRQVDLTNRMISHIPANLKDPESIKNWREEMMEQGDALKVKELGIQGELRPHPLQLGADGLAHSGLFSGSALNFGMDSSTQRAQLEELRAIRREIGRSPHAL